MRRLSRILTRATAAAAALAVITSGAAIADDLAIDGDGVAPIATSAVAFGDVCAGTIVTKPVLLAVRATTQHPGANPNIFANGSTVSVAVGTISGAGLSAAVPAAPGNQVTMPSNWVAQSSGSQTGSITSVVTLVAGAPRVLNGTVNYTVTGPRSTSSPSTPLTTTSGLTATANVINCDTTPPVLGGLTNQVLEATGPAGAVATFAVTATDAAPLSPAVTCNPLSGSTFPIAKTTVNCSATDNAGNTGSGSFTVTVQDTLGPVIANTPTDVTVEATGADGAVVSFTNPTATDVVDGTRPVTCTPASGSTFALGTNTVNCTSTDSRGNSSSSNFGITVEDTTAPVIVGPGAITAEATSSAGAAVTYTASATDIVDGSVTPDCVPPSGTTFALGLTSGSCSASDEAGNSASQPFSVTVIDTKPPTLTLTGNSAEATGPAGAAVSYTATASDLVDGSVTPVCDTASGSVFPLGTTTVSCTATDTRGNSSSGTLDVTVVDTTAPALSLPAAAVVAATGPAGAPYTYTATATDLVDGAVLVTCTPVSGSPFPLGVTTPVNCTATDAAGNTASGGFTVSVQYGRDGGILQPINPDNTSLFSRGRVVPVKFQLKNDQPTGFATTAWTLKRVTVGCISGEGIFSEDVPSATPNASFRYDAAADQYIYNADFKDKAAGTCWKIEVNFNDGSVPLTSAVFKLNR